MNEKGLQINNDFKRYNARFNYDYKIRKNINTGVRFKGNWSKYVYALEEGFTDDNSSNTAGFDMRYAISGILPYDPVTGYYGGVSRPPQATPFVYGSPIPTPMPVNPATGLMPSNSSGYYYESYPINSIPFRGRVDNSTLINPTLVNPRINDSTLINPVIVNEPVYRVPVYERRSPIIYFSN